MEKASGKSLTMEEVGTETSHRYHSSNSGYTTIDQVVAPFLNAVKKSTHDVILAKDMERFAPVEAMMHAELDPIPDVIEESLASMLERRRSLTDTMGATVSKLVTFTNSPYGRLYLTHPEYNSIYVCPSFIYSDFHRISFEIVEGETLAQFVAYCKELVVTEDVLEDLRFPLGLGQHGLCMKAAMGIPIVTHQGVLAAVIELGREEPYTEIEISSVVLTSGWIGSAVGIISDSCILSKRETFLEYILHMTCYYSSSKILPVENIITYFMMFAKDYVNAAHARLLIVWNNDREQAFDAYEECTYKQTGLTTYCKLFSAGINDKKTIAGEAIKKMKLLNLTLDEAIEYEKWRNDEDYFSSLCMPIANDEGHVLGAIELVNKMRGYKFTEEDEEAIKKLAAFGYIILSHYKLNLKKRNLNAGVGLYSELFCKHIQPCDFFVSSIKESFTPPSNLWQFDYCPPVNIQHLGLVTKGILQHLGTLEFTDKAVDFIASLVRSHTWHSSNDNGFIHDFLCFHCVAVIIEKHPTIFDMTEKKEMLLAALMHTINVKRKNARFSTKTDQIHYNKHFVKIILEAFEMCDYKMQQSILELAHVCNAKTSRPYQIRLIKLILTDSLSFTNPTHRVYLKTMVMRVAEKAVWYKPFNYSAFLSKLLLEENIILSKEPLKKSDFVKTVMEELVQDCLPDIEILSFFLPEVAQLENFCRDALCQWKVVQNAKKVPVWQPDNTVLSIPPEYDLDLIGTFTDNVSDMEIPLTHICNLSC